MDRNSKTLIVVVATVILAGGLLLLAASLGLMPVRAVAEQSASEPLPGYWPTDGWRTSAPEAVGMDSAQLLAAYDYIKEHDVNLHSLIVVRQGYIVLEAYFHPYQPTTSHQLASATKSVTGTLIGIAIDQGFIENVNEPVVNFFPERTINHLDASKQALTLKHLLTLTTGMACGDLLTMEQSLQESTDWVGYLLDLPVAVSPGTSWSYCSQAVHILPAVLEQATGMSAREFANANLFQPMGIPEVSEEQWEVDGQGIQRGDTGLILTPRDMAKLGYLYLRGGEWDGAQVVPAQWVSAATSEQAEKDDGDSYGYLWTVYPGDSHYAALGLGGQQIHVFPEYDLIVVTTAALAFGGDTQDINKLLSDYIIPAVKAGGPIAANPEAASALASAASAVQAPETLPVSLPTTAYEISGRTFILEPNPMGWEELTLVFEREAGAATVTLGGQDPSLIGLDGRFRIAEAAGAPPTALRGQWIDDRAFRVELLEQGSFMEYVITLTFAGDEVDIAVLETTLNSIDLKIYGRAEN